ncbi:extracellular solute-binding protein [Brachybacterium sp.]|uniref:extracellular solute-binding protein n=1 Tax=Brachybacterium sp. TaxID=1891286 RepID=UPI002ED67A0C
MKKKLTTPTVRRRSLVRIGLLGSVCAAGLPLLTSCGEISGGEGSVQMRNSELDILPEFTEWPLPAEPDLVGEPPDHPSAYLTYPDPVQKAVPEPRGGEGSYSIYVPNWGPSMAKDDPYYTAMAEAMGGTRINFVQNDPNAYTEASVQWIKAQEFGDGILLFSWMTSADANFDTTVINRFANLSEVLSGDISERWPLLAGRGDAAWAASVWAEDPENPEETSGIYGIPWTSNGGPGNGFFYRADLLEEAGLEVPTTVEELLEVAREWTDDPAGRWAIGGTDYMSSAWFRLTPGSGWSSQDGEIVHNNERPEFKEWVAFQRQIREEGLVHPNVGTPTFDGKAAQRAGDVLFDQDGWSRWIDVPAQVAASGENPDFVLDALGPLTFEGREPMYHGAGGVSGWLFLSNQLEKEQIEEILDVANWCASPAGTVEQEMIVYGIEGEHFERGEDGRPSFTEAGIAAKQDSFAFTAMSGVVQNLLEGPADLVQRRFDFNASVLPVLVKDEFETARITTPDGAAQAGTIFDEKVNDIINGRAELSTLDEAVATWKADGGDVTRAVYQEVHASLKGE